MVYVCPKHLCTDGLYMRYCRMSLYMRYSVSVHSVRVRSLRVLSVREQMQSLQAGTRTPAIGRSSRRIALECLELSFLRRVWLLRPAGEHAQVLFVGVLWLHWRDGGARKRGSNAQARLRWGLGAELASWARGARGRGQEEERPFWDLPDFFIEVDASVQALDARTAVGVDEDDAFVLRLGALLHRRRLELVVPALFALTRCVVDVDGRLVLRGFIALVRLPEDARHLELLYRLRLGLAPRQHLLAATRGREAPCAPPDRATCRADAGRRLARARAARARPAHCAHLHDLERLLAPLVGLDRVPDGHLVILLGGLCVLGHGPGVCPSPPVSRVSCPFLALALNLNPPSFVFPATPQRACCEHD